MIVLINDKRSAIKSDLKCTGNAIDNIFENVKLEYLSVRPKKKTITRGMMINPIDQKI